MPLVRSRLARLDGTAKTRASTSAPHLRFSESAPKRTADIVEHPLPASTGKKPGFFSRRAMLAQLDIRCGAAAVMEGDVDGQNFLACRRAPRAVRRVRV